METGQRAPTMTVWNKIGEDGPPELEQEVWLFRSDFSTAMPALYRKPKDRDAYWAHNYRDDRSIKSTDQWTPIVPPELPVED